MDRIEKLANHLTASSISLTDNRTGKSYEMPIKGNFITAKDLSKVKGDEGQPLRMYDPGYMNTVNCVLVL